MFLTSITIQRWIYIGDVIITLYLRGKQHEGQHNSNPKCGQTAPL